MIYPCRSRKTFKIFCFSQKFAKMRNIKVVIKYETINLIHKNSCKAKVSYLFQVLIDPFCEGFLLYRVPLIWNKNQTLANE